MRRAASVDIARRFEGGAHLVVDHLDLGMMLRMRCRPSFELLTRHTETGRDGYRSKFLHQN